MEIELFEGRTGKNLSVDRRRKKKMKRNLNKNVYCRDDLVTFELLSARVKENEKNDIAVWFKELTSFTFTKTRKEVIWA